MVQDEEFTGQDGGEGVSRQRKGFAKAQRRDSRAYSGFCIELGITGARKACGEGVGGRKTGATGILNKVMIRSDVRLMKLPQEAGWKPN